MIENGIIFVKLNGSTKLSVRLGIIFQFIVDHTFCIEDRRKWKVIFDQLIEKKHGFTIILLTFIEKSKMIQQIDVAWI